MRWLKLLFYSFLILVIQTVIFPRLNLFGAVPDLVLISVVVFAILEERNRATLFSASLGLVQDLLSVGMFLNTATKVLISIIAGNSREEFAGDPSALAAGLVAIFTPAALLAEALILYLFAHNHFAPGSVFLRIVLTTIYNLILLPIVFPLLQMAASDE
jgi:rod shape-determining protein MreD